MPDLGPLPAALLSGSAGPYLALILSGFVLGILGQLAKARWLLAAGVVLIALGALLLVLAGGLPTGHPPTPIEAE